VNLNPGTTNQSPPTVTASSGSTLEGVLKLEVYDADGVKLGDTQSPNGGAVAKLENVAVTKAGPVFIRVKDYWKSSAETTYSLSISSAGPVAGAESGAAPAPSAPPPAPAAPPPSAPPAAPVAAVPAASAPAVKVPVSEGGLDIMQALNQLTFMQKAKWVGMYVLLPAFVIFLLGWIFGYVGGRKSGKRKALAKMNQAPKK
jgi:hypothetical protein